MLLIKNGQIVTMDQKGTIFENGDILIEDGKISAMGSSEDLTLHEEKITEVIDASEMLVLPGLINAHSHSQSALTKLTGSGDRTNVITALWYGFAHGLNKTNREIHVSALLHAIQLLKSGCTCVIDQFHYQGLPKLSEIEQAVQAYSLSGMRALIAVDLRDRQQKTILPDTAQQIPELAKEVVIRRTLPLKDQLDLYREAANRWHHFADGRIHIIPSTPVATLCSDDLLQELIQFARRYNTIVTCHLLEHPKERKTAIDIWGKPEVEHLAEIGFLDQRLCVAHAIWVTDDDIERLAEHGTSVSHNPELNLRLGGGLTPVRKMMDTGINVALGTDSSTNQIMFDPMKLAALIHRLGKTNPLEWIYADEILSMVTNNAARAFSLGDRIGSLELGKDADLILLDLNSPWLVPLTEIPSRLVYFENGESVDTVIVRGEVVIRNGEFTTIDDKSVIEEAKELSKNLIERNKELYDLADTMTEILNPEIQALGKEFSQDIRY